MKFNTDSHFVIGHRHITSGKPCQDYSLAGTTNDGAFAIVSDGCSSGGLTDVGSRIQALTTARAIRGCSDLADKFGPNQIGLIRGDGIRQAGMFLGLRPEDMLATCLYTYITADGGFVRLEGDGVIALKNRDGSIIVHRYDWNDNMPFYPGYDENLAGFIQAHGNDLAADKLQHQSWAINSHCKLLSQETEQISLEKGIRGVTIELSPDHLQNLEYIIVFTDGVTQVEGVDWKEVVTELLAFKTTEGDFAKRRMNRFVKDALKKGRGPVDDISCAVIQLQH